MRYEWGKKLHHAALHSKILREKKLKIMLHAKAKFQNSEGQ